MYALTIAASGLAGLIGCLCIVVGIIAGYRATNHDGLTAAATTFFIGLSSVLLSWTLIANAHPPAMP